MSVVLITGMTGFTGRYLANMLRARGLQVCGISHDVHSPKDGLYRGDLLDRQSLVTLLAKVRPDYVVHLAAIAFVAHGDADGLYRTNVVGSRNLLESIAGSGHEPRSILLASSANLYGNTAASPLVESTPPAPTNDYAVSKVAMEYMARLWTDRLPITFVRPFNYTGVGQSLSFLLPKVVDHFRRGASEIELGNLDIARDFSDVRMVVGAYSKLLDVGATGDVFNVCSGVAWSLRDTIAMMERIAGYKINVKVNPAFVRQGEVESLRGCNEKLQSAIGPLSSIPLEDTLRWMYQT